MIQGPIPQVAAAKPGVPDGYTSSSELLRDLALLLEWAGGRRHERYPPASMVSGEDCSHPLDT